MRVDDDRRAAAEPFDILLQPVQLILPQHTEAAREELYPLVLRAAAKSSIVVRCVRGIDSRGFPA